MALQYLNTYRIARACTIIAAGLCIATAATEFVPLPKDSLGITSSGFILLLNSFLAWTYRRRAEKFASASRKYERQPWATPTEITWAVLTPYQIRIIAFLLPLFFCAAILAGELTSNKGWLWALTEAVTRLWLMFGDSIAIYFAMVPPSGRSRKQKSRP